MSGTYDSGASYFILVGRDGLVLCEEIKEPPYGILIKAILLPGKFSGICKTLWCTRPHKFFEGIVVGVDHGVDHGDKIANVDL